MHFSPDAVAGFVGVVTGSIMTGGFQFTLATRAERADRRVAIRKVRSELDRASMLIEVYQDAVDTGDADEEMWRKLLERLRLEEWQQYSSVLGRWRRFRYHEVSAAYLAIEETLRQQTPPSTLNVFAAAIGVARRHLAEIDRAGF